MIELTRGNINNLLEAVGEQLALRGASVSMLLVGGAALSLRGFVSRTTLDVDVFALVDKTEGKRSFRPPDPLPPALYESIEIVGRDFGLSHDWMNTLVASIWDQGVPESLPDDILWRTYGSLEIGLVGRQTLISLKLYAIIDQGKQSKHFEDLIELCPTDGELNIAVAWVSEQDASPEFRQFVTEAVQHVKAGSREHH